MRWALLLGAALAAAPALGAKPGEAPPAKAPAGSRATAVDFTPIDDRIQRGDWQGAATELDTLLADAAQSADHAAAWSRMGRALKAGGLPAAALAAWGEGLRVGPAAVGPDYPALIDTALALHEEVWIGGLLGADFSVPMDGSTRSDVAFLAARHHVAHESWGTALGLLPLVTEESRFYVDAIILRAITLTQQGRYEPALEDLLAARDRSASRDLHFRNVLDLNIARTYYALGNWGRAMEYYGRVQRGDAMWPEAQFERAWAHFRADDMAGTIALLLTHDSPFFTEWYFPEGDLLRAQALFLMCKFPATTQAIDKFQGNYTPILGQLRSALTALDADGATADGRTALQGGTTKLPAALLRRLGGDLRFQGALEGIGVADSDLEKLARVGQPWSARVASLLKARRDARSGEEGERILAFARDAEGDLNDMLTGIELTRVDLLSFEADMYQRAAATGELTEFGDPLGTLRKEQRKKNKRLWPFEGEFWADELGWYKVTARPECPAGMARGGS